MQYECNCVVRTILYYGCILLTVRLRFAMKCDNQRDNQSGSWNFLVHSLCYSFFLLYLNTNKFSFVKTYDVVTMFISISKYIQHVSIPLVV